MSSYSLAQGTLFAQIGIGRVIVMNKNQNDKFEVFRRIALNSAAGANMSQSAELALKLTSDYIGLEAATLMLFDQSLAVTLSVTHASSTTQRQRLSSLEEELFSTLRREKQLSSAYLSFDSEIPVHSFTMPLKYEGKTLGAVIGLQEGTRTIISEDNFIEALSAMLAIIYIATQSGSAGAPDRKLLEKEKLSGILETAVTVNHEVNNPLTAILGNVQLLLLKRDDLDDELRGKLKIVEDAAMKIKNVTQRLLLITKPKTKQYTDGTNMLDLSEDEE